MSHYVDEDDKRD